MSRNLVVYALAVLAGLVGYFLLRSVVGDGIMSILALIGLGVGVVIVTRNLRTNRKVTDASVDQRTEALRFAPVLGKAALYVFRSQFVGRAVGINVLVDGRETAQLKSPRFARILLTPGTHRLAGYTGTNKKPADGEGVELVANAGEIYVAKCEVEAQMVGVSIKFTPMSVDAARADLQKITRMVVPDIAEV
ncbi:MAG: hypothetical protein IPG56_09630 [Caulobacteraceae bacterium]|nr:hypothetical protein [Caulobacteraceae bacterium]